MVANVFHLSDPNEIYRDVFASVSATDWSGLDPIPQMERGDGPDYPVSIRLGSHFAIYDGKVSGASSLGFDGVSNPVSQCLPLGVTRTIQVATGPKVGDIDYPFVVYGGNNMDFSPSNVLQALTGVQVNASGAEREVSMAIPATRTAMTINVHSQRTLTVGIFKVLTRSWASCRAIRRARLHAHSWRLSGEYSLRCRRNDGNGAGLDRQSRQY